MKARSPSKTSRRSARASSPSSPRSSTRASTTRARRSRRNAGSPDRGAAAPPTSVASAARNHGLRSTTLKALLRRALRILGFPRATVSLVLTDDARIRVLNRDFLEIDRPTDVLSFPLTEAGDLEDRDRELFLGEIYISVETAQAQAREARHPLAREIALLVVHGLLHLLGHDHATPAERLRMRAEESRLLRELKPML